MNDSNKKEPLSILRPNRLELTKTVESGKVKQNFQHGRSKTVTVEVRKTRTFSSDDNSAASEVKRGVVESNEIEKSLPSKSQHDDGTLTSEEMQSRLRALESAKSRPVERVTSERKISEIEVDTGEKAAERPRVVQSPILQRIAEEKRNRLAKPVAKAEPEKPKEVVKETPKPKEILRR
ncbi:MAG: translation initiation factor IF-2 associated domain-containing protein, partial [Pseudomonadota bacterium]